MRPEALRPATATAAASATTKLSTRLSKGEKRNRKRLAEVGAVYDADPVVRIPADILARGQDTKQDTDPGQPAQAPVAKNKWLTASITDDAAPWSAASSTKPTAATPPTRAPGSRWSMATTTRSTGSRPKPPQRGVNVTILIDFIHVLEYLSAPRGALLYPPQSGEGWEEISLGLMAYP